VFPATLARRDPRSARWTAPDQPTDPLEVVELLAREVDKGVVATAGPRYFGYVTGGALPATVGADWLTTIWDQCAGLGPLGPSVAVVEEITGDWLKDVLGLPQVASFALTTGCQMAHVTGLAAARHAVLEEHGWDVRERGLAGSPPISVVVGRLRHVTVDRALRLLGIGASQLVVVPADSHGRMSPTAARHVPASTARSSCARRPER
jgi:glutamate/tyrosine decarboxylase-like PLP-dependent enzyme